MLTVEEENGSANHKRVKKICRSAGEWITEVLWLQCCDYHCALGVNLSLKHITLIGTLENMTLMTVRCACMCVCECHAGSRTIMCFIQYYI